mmetsp:Transcript_90836/g.164030  ORF Transcript_90836/g.164030 Transcript_90836/m.164030 type:complete len:209 (+) Transcript_90836:348-974(+)
MSCLASGVQHQYAQPCDDNCKVNPLKECAFVGIQSLGLDSHNSSPNRQPPCRARCRFYSAKQTEQTLQEARLLDLSPISAPASQQRRIQTAAGLCWRTEVGVFFLSFCEAIGRKLFLHLRSSSELVEQPDAVLGVRAPTIFRNLFHSRLLVTLLTLRTRGCLGGARRGLWRLLHNRLLISALQHAAVPKWQRQTSRKPVEACQGMRCL